MVAVNGKSLRARTPRLLWTALRLGELILRVCESCFGKIVGAARFESVEGQSDERQNFHEKPRVSKVPLRSIPEIIKVAACWCASLIFLALGLIHIHSIAPNRNGFAFVGFLARIHWILLQNYSPLPRFPPRSGSQSRAYWSL
jgi:hypothetical protein